MKASVTIHESGYDRHWISQHYDEYLKSEHWQVVRARYAEHHPRSQSCTVCRSKSRLNLHHRTYERVGQERYGDLCYLCETCHHEAHRRLKQKQWRWLTLFNIDRRLRKQAKKSRQSNGFRCQVCGKGGRGCVGPQGESRCLCLWHQAEYRGRSLPDKFQGNYSRRMSRERKSR